MGNLSPHRRVVLAQGVGQAAVLLATPFLSRQVPVIELGTYQTALAIALALQPLATLRVDFVLAGIADDEVASRLLARGRAAGYLILAVAALAGVILFSVGQSHAAEVAWCAGPLAVAYSWLALDGGRFLRTQQLGALAARNLVSGIAAAVLQCIIAIFLPTAAALTGAIVAARLLAVVVSRRRAAKPAIPRVARGLSDATYSGRRMMRAVSASLLDTAIMQSLVIVPGATLGPEAAGYTGMSQRVTTSPASLVVGGLGQVAQARVSQAIIGGEGDAAAALRPILLRLGVFAGALGVLVAFVAPHLVVPILGPAWRPLQWMLPIIAPALALQVLSLPLVPVGMMLHVERSLLRLNVVRVALIVGGTAAIASVTNDLRVTVTWWSITTAIGYVAQLCLIIWSARTWHLRNGTRDDDTI